MPVDQEITADVPESLIDSASLARNDDSAIQARRLTPSGRFV
jgi:hypothetical protein